MPARKARTSRKRSKARPKKSPSGAVTVVNMIPRSLSGEHHQDSEPSIAVNPDNPMQIAGSAFTPDPGGGAWAPIYVSSDGGQTWVLNSIVPGNDPTAGTSDITLQFGGKSNALYAGILRGDSAVTRLNILRTTDCLTPNPMKILVDRAGQGVDQPYVQAATMANGPSKGKDRVYVGDNDFNAPSGRTATIDQSLDATKTSPAFTTIRIESRTTAGQDGPPIRPVIHPDGTVYAVYHAWRSYNDKTGAGTADIVLVRDDNGGAGSTTFKDLVDPADGKAGMRIVQGARFNFDGYLGLQRTGGDVAMTVDPGDSSRVFVAYNDDQGSAYVLHLLRSVDRGQTWSNDVRTIHDALNPALAINSDGVLGFLYQQLTGSGAAQRWVTKLELMKSDGSSSKSLVLAKTPADTPPKTFDPYLGDYEHLMSVGKDFYGVFSANNTPRKQNFPNGVTYQRNANFGTQTLLHTDNTTPVKVSIDPFFFRVAG
jgi:hypothetical protein